MGRNMSVKYSEIVKPLGVPTESASLMIGNQELFLKMHKASWIKPIIDTNRCRLYDTDDVKRCWERLKSGDYPEVKE